MKNEFSNKNFTVNKLNFLEGTLQVQVKHLYSIEVPIASFIIDEENIETSLRFDFIKLTKPIKEYIGNTIKFPVNPNVGYIDGSIYLRDAHNPVDITQIKFLKLQESKLTVELSMDFIFEFEKIGFKNEKMVKKIILEII